MRSDNPAKTINKDTGTKTNTIVNRGNNDNGN
jgi:hypothetical protein